jgi:hypothetical protein
MNSNGPLSGPWPWSSGLVAYSAYRAASAATAQPDKGNSLGPTCSPDAARRGHAVVTARRPSVAAWPVVARRCSSHDEVFAQTTGVERRICRARRGGDGAHLVVRQR